MLDWPLVILLLGVGALVVTFYGLRSRSAASLLTERVQLLEARDAEHAQRNGDMTQRLKAVEAALKLTPTEKAAANVKALPGFMR